jgi:hypothetical protein
VKTCPEGNEKARFSRSAIVSNGSWKCSRCDSSVGSGFEICWNCGTSIDGTPDPNFQPAVARQPFVSTCRKCGYSLVGIDASRRCPECGERIVRDGVDTPTAVENDTKRVSVNWAVYVMIVLGLLVLLVPMMIDWFVGLMMTSGMR